jgi:1A family penicillin-binding protein
MPDEVVDSKLVSKKAAPSRKKTVRMPRFVPTTVALAVCGILLAIGAVFAYSYIFKDLPDPTGLRNYGVIPLSTKIYDRNGELLYEIFNEENRSQVKLEDLPPYVPQATISIEDKDFYKHGGISVFGGVLRAAKEMVMGGSKQGGSTLTQQLVKSALLTPERTIRRKLREAVLAIQIEQLLTKDEILELYLSQVPYGGVSYGIQAASHSFFDKDAKDLKLHEAALLAGLPAAPTAYNPYTNLEKAKARQEQVLERMEDDGYITAEQHAAASKAELNIRPRGTFIKAPHFVFYVRDILEKEYGRPLVEEGGLQVITTLDDVIQASAEAAVQEEVAQLKRLRVSNGAALVTRPATGEILAMVGSADLYASGSGFYNVTTATRQPGSSIKPITYAMGIEMGIVNPASVFNDGPTCFQNEGQPKPYCPVNYDGSYRGPVQLRYALANSLNIPAVKMLAKIGVKEFVASASSFMIKSIKDPSKYGLSLTLGGGEVPMTEMAQAFSSFANEGVPREVVSILKVTDKNGKVLYKYNDPNLVKDVHKPLQYPNFLGIQGKRAISKETAFEISHILQDNGARTAAFGPSSELVIKGKTVSVKTGTTNDLRDNWTIGYTPNFLTAVWVGNNNNTPMSAVASGVTGASPIWNTIMTKVLAEQPDLQPRKPDGVNGRTVCTTTGRTPSADNALEGGEACPTRFEYITRGRDNVGAGVMSREMVWVNKNTGQPVYKEGEPDAEQQEKLVIFDGLTKYCLECNHEGEPHVTVDVVQYLLQLQQKKEREIRIQN